MGKIDEVLTKFDAWENRREKIAAAEDAGEWPVRDWHASDDQAVDLLGELVDAVRALPVPGGGFDGFVFSFGDGCDEDTVNMTLPLGWGMEVTLSSGETFSAFFRGTDLPDGSDDLVTLWTTGDDPDAPVDLVVAFDKIVGVEIL